MATVFPFNKIPTIPLKILSVLLPVFLKQKKFLNKVIGELQQKVDGLSNTATCGDAEINAIKQDLEQIKQLVENIQRIANLLQPITNGLQTATTIANILIPISLAIPSIVGVPEGPKEQTISALAELLQNIAVILNILNGIVSTINDINERVNSIVSLAQSKLNSVCNGDDFSIDSGYDVLQVSTTSNTGISNPALNNFYNSEFYRDVNVSDEDLQGRIDQIQNLLNEQLSVLDNLIETPSTVFKGTGFPDINLGKIGDYYINTDTQQVYGPKPTQNSWS